MMVTLSNDVQSLVVAGSSYNASCSVVLNVPVTQLRLVWTHVTSGAEVASTMIFNGTENQTSSELVLDFAAISISNTGQYTCTAVAEDNAGVSISRNESLTIDVQRKFYCSFTNCVIISLVICSTRASSCIDRQPNW